MYDLVLYIFLNCTVLMVCGCVMKMKMMILEWRWFLLFLTLQMILISVWATCWDHTADQCFDSFHQRSSPWIREEQLRVFSICTGKKNQWQLRNRARRHRDERKRSSWKSTGASDAWPGFQTNLQNNNKETRWWFPESLFENEQQQQLLFESAD